MLQIGLNESRSLQGQIHFHDLAFEIKDVCVACLGLVLWLNQDDFTITEFELFLFPKSK
jgi:hypothetical protein